MVKCRICRRRNLVIRSRTKIDPEMMLAFKLACLKQNNPNDEVDVDSWQYICRLCKMYIGMEMRNPTQLGAIDINPIPLQFLIPVVEEGKCFICDSPNPLYETTLTTRVSLYIIGKLYVDPRTRICNSHVDCTTQLIKSTPEILRLQADEQLVRLNNSEVQQWFEEMRQICLHFQNLPMKMSEYMNRMNSKDFKDVFGITASQFDQLCSKVEDFRSADGMKCSRHSIMMFLLKLRQGQSLSYLRALFNYDSDGAVSSHIKTVRQALLKHFVPEHLGTAMKTREEILTHVTPLARTLHLPEDNNENIVFTIDGTYLYVPKSFNFTELKRTFCFHKGRHLLKMTMCVMPDGYILDAHGPYYSDAKNNDAATISHNLTTDDTEGGLREFLQDGDVVIVDRGYRDCIDFLDRLGLKVNMPAYLQRGEHQHTTLDANNSRIVTKTRWIVEARNGHIKTMFKFFDKVIAAGNIPFIGEYFKIACALINAFRPVIHARDDSVDVGRILLARKATNNEVKEYIETHHLISRSVTKWAKMQEVEIEEFPRMTLEDLRSLTLGEYQIKQAGGYNAEAEEESEDRAFLVALVNRTLLRAKLPSRHKNKKHYHQFIQFIPEEQGATGVQGWYCTCTTGARTVGMCSHVCAIIWFLSINRYEPFMKRPKRRLLGIALDAGQRDETG